MIGSTTNKFMGLWRSPLRQSHTECSQLYNCACNNEFDDEMRDRSMREDITIH